MDLKEFDYKLPESLIAAYPSRAREAARLLVLYRQTGEVIHSVFAEIGLGWIIRGVAAVRESYNLVKRNWTIPQFVARHTHYDPQTLKKIEAFATSMHGASFWTHAWKHILFNIPSLSHIRSAVRNHPVLLKLSA